MRIFHGDWSHAQTMLLGPRDKPGGSTGFPPLPDYLDPETFGTTQEDMAVVAQLLAQYPGARRIDDTHWIATNGRIIELSATSTGKTTFKQWTEGDTNAYLKYLGGASGATGGGGGGSSRLASDDPRYWEMQQQELDLDWAKLTSDEKMQAEQIRAQLINAGLDAETARRQALASLIQSRNSNSIDLASTSGNIAAQAAQFAANPRDAIAELQFRGATGMGPAFGAIGNAEFGGYQSKLDDKFQQMFGGVAGDLSRAREYVNSIPPTEFFGAETRQALDLPLLPQQEMLSGYGQQSNPLDAMVQKLQGMSAPDQESFRRYTDPAYRERQTRIEDAYTNDPVAAEDFFRKIAELNGGVRPPAAEDGINMNIHEPAMVMGMSGKIYATMAENDPEQLRVIPLPSVKKARAAQEKMQKERMKNGQGGGDMLKQARQEFLEATQGAQRMAMGGTVTSNPYGKEIRGLTGGIGYGRRGRQRGVGSASDLAQRLRAGGKIQLGNVRRSPRASSVAQNPTTRTPVTDIARNDTGLPGTGGGAQPAQPNDFMSLIRNQLAGLGAATPQGQGLPDPRMLADGVYSRMETDPVLKAYIEAAFSRVGIDSSTLWNTAKQFRPTGLNTGGGVPSVRFT